MKRFRMITCSFYPRNKSARTSLIRGSFIKATTTDMATKGVFKLLQLNRAYSISFNSSDVAIFFWSWNLKDCIEVQEKKNKVFASLSPAPGRCLVSTFSTNREIRNFHVVVEQWRQRNVLKRSVMHVQGCCLANLNLLFFCRSRWCRGRRCLKHWVFFSLEPIIDYVPIYGPLVQKFNVSFLLNPPTHIKSSPALK